MAGKITPGSGAGRGGFPWGPEPQIFSAASLTAAKALRDAHAQANVDWIQEFVDDLADDSKPDRLVGLRDTTENRLTLQAYRGRTASYTSIFGATVGGVTLPTLPEEDLIAAYGPEIIPGSRGSYYRLNVNSVDDANALVDELNRGFDAGDPRVVHDTENDIRIEITERSSVYPVRESSTAWGVTAIENDGTTVTFPAAPASGARAPYILGTRIATDPDGSRNFEATLYVTEVDMSAAALARINSLVSIWNDGQTDTRNWDLTFTDAGGNDIFAHVHDVRAGNNASQHHYIFTIRIQSGTQTVNGDVTGLDFEAHFVTQWRIQMPTDNTGNRIEFTLSEGNWDIQDRDYEYMWETVGGSASGGGIFERGPEPNYFTAATLTAAETLRNTQAHDLTEAAWIKAYRDARDSDPLKIIFLESTDDQQITIQTFHETETSYATVFGVEYGGVTMPAKPSNNLFIDVDSNEGPTFRFASTRANVLALVAAANAARAALDPWVVKTIDTDANTIRLALRADVSMRVDRAQSSIWGKTFLDESGTSRTISTYSLPSHGNEPFIRTDSSTSKRYLRIPEGGGGGGTRRVDATLAVWALGGNAGGTRPWQVSFRDSGGSGRTAGVAALTRGTLTGQYHYYDFELDSTLATATSDGNITNMAITGNFPTAYQLLLPVEDEAEGVASSNNVVPSAWDLEDRDYSHSWRTIGAMTGELGLDQDEVDDRINTLVQQFARDTTTDIPGARIAAGSLAEGKLATAVRTKLNATALTLLTGDTTWTADQTAAANGKIYYFVSDSNGTLTMARPSGSGDIAFLAVNATGAFATFTLDATPDAARVAPLTLQTASEVGLAVYDSDLSRWELHHLSQQEIITADRTFTAAEVQFFDTRTIVCQPSSDITIIHPQPSPDSDRAIRYLNLTGNDSSVTLTTSTAGLRDRTLEIPQGQTATANYDSSNDKWTWVGAWELGNRPFGSMGDFTKTTAAGDPAIGQFKTSGARNISFGLAAVDFAQLEHVRRFFDSDGTQYDVASWSSGTDTLTATLTSGSNTISQTATTFSLHFPSAQHASDVPVDASGFSGNLATTDTTVQAVATKVDGLALSGGSVGSPSSERDLAERVLFAAQTNIDADPWVDLTPVVGSGRAYVDAAETGTTLAILEQITAADVTAKRVRVNGGQYNLIFTGSATGDTDRAAPELRIIDADDSTVLGQTNAEYLRADSTADPVVLQTTFRVASGEQNLKVQMRTSPSAVEGSGQGQFDLAANSKLTLFRWGGSGTGGSGTDDQTAAEVTVDAGDFDGNLGSGDTDVQTALETIDGLSLGISSVDYSRTMRRPGSPLGTGTSWDSVRDPGLYLSTSGSHPNAPFTGRAYQMLVLRYGGTGNEVWQFAMDPQSRGIKYRTYTSSTWSAWADMIPTGGGTTTAANQRAELHAQVIERQRNDDDIDITSGQVADTPGHTVERYGYARAAGPTGYLAGGSIAAASGGDAADTIADALVAAWSHNSVSTFRFDSDTPLLDRVRIGSTTYALTQSASDASTANWGNGSFDEYQVASTESNRDPLNFGSTSSTVEDVQFIRPDGSPFAFTLEDQHRALDLDSAVEWTGVEGTNHAVTGLLNEMKLVSDFADDLDTVDIQIFAHHPTISVPSSGRERRTIQLADDLGTLLFRQGDTRIFKSDAEDGQDYSAGTDFTRELESVYFRNADVPTDADSSLVMVELGRISNTNIRTSFVYDIRARRMTSGAPDNAAWSPDTGSVLRASWLPSGNSGYVRDTNFVAPTGNDARAADTYRLYGSESELTQLRNRLVAWNARADGSSARLVFRDLDGLPQSVSIRAWGAVSTDNTNRLWRYLDLTFAGNSTIFKPPAHATPVVVTVPQERSAAESADFFEEIGEFDSPSTGNWVSSAVARSDGELFAVSVDDDDIQIYREADLNNLATVTLGSNAFSADGKTWTRHATGGAQEYLGRTADGRYAIGPSGAAKFRFFKVNEETGFSITEAHRDTAGIELTEAGNTVGSSIDIPDSDLIAIQFDHPQETDDEGDYRVFLFRREDLLDRLEETADTSQTPARLISFPLTAGELCIGHSGSTGRFIFAARSITGAATTVTIHPVVYSVTRADGFGLGSAVSRNITSTATTDIRIPATRFLAISPGSRESNARQYADRALRFFARAPLVALSSPSVANTATWLGFRAADQTLIGVANQNSNLWVNLGTASRLQPFRIYPVNARSDPQAQSAAPTGAYLEVQPPLNFVQSVAGANSVVIRETGEDAISIIWPDGIDHLKVTITPSSDFTNWGRLEYRQPGTNSWHYLEGKDTGHTILMSAGLAYSYRFPAASFRSTPTNEVSQLKLRVVRANEDNTANTGNLTGSLDVEVDYESVEDAHDIVWTTLLDGTRTVDIAPQAVSASLSTLTWHDENFEERIEIAKLQFISIHYLPTTGGTGTLSLKLDRGDIDYMGLNAGVPANANAIMSVAWLQGFADNARVPTFRVPANWVNNIGDSGTPNWIVGLKSDGVYATGLRFAAFRTTHGLRQIVIQHLR